MLLRVDFELVHVKLNFYFNTVSNAPMQSLKNPSLYKVRYYMVHLWILPSVVTVGVTDIDF